MKNSQRLDYAGLAEVLGQRGLVEPARLALALQACAQGSMALPETLVEENLATDWDLARVVCELYGLPFLPVEMYAPAPAAAEGLDREFLRVNKLVPMERFGDLLTVCMPVLVTAEVLGLLAAQTNLTIVPVVGTVQGNREWVREHLPVRPQAALPADVQAAFRSSDTDFGWSNIFDAGDEAVRMELEENQDEK